MQNLGRHSKENTCDRVFLLTFQIHIYNTALLQRNLKQSCFSEYPFCRTVLKTKIQAAFNLLGSPCAFSKNVFFRMRLQFCFYVTFNIIINHIFPEHFIEILLTAQKIWLFQKNFFFKNNHVYHFFRILWFFLVTKKLTRHI